MSEATNHIAEEIDGARENLKANVEALEARVRNAVDWRHYVDTHPAVMLTGAFVGGALLSLLVRRYTSGGGDSSHLNRRDLSRVIDATTQHWDEISQALVGTGAGKIRELLGEIIPGFAEQLAAAVRKRSA